MGKYLNSPAPRFFHCHSCGAEVPSKALACPECGADERTGLHGDTISSDVTEDPDGYSYDEFIKREFGNPAKPQGLHWVWWLTGIILLVLMALSAFQY